MGSKDFFALLVSRSVEIIDREGLRRKIASRRSLRVKLGVDPTTPDLHLGHAVPLRMLRSFQDAGHQAVLIIGDFTGQIGDPSGKLAARRQLTASETKANERTYRAQIGTILDLRRTEVRRNSEWFGRMRLAEFLALLAKFPLKSAWEREDFQARLRAGRAVYLHEAMYHVLQAYDSVAVRADVELGSLDQRLNLLAGRELGSRLGRIVQDVVLLPYLIGLDGREKMSKTAGNTINLRDSARDMFGKVMSILDALIANYAALAAWLPPERVRGIERRLKAGENPRDVKIEVAEAVAERYHGAAEARRARSAFLSLFSKRERDVAMPGVTLPRRAYAPLELLVAIHAARSVSDARRLLRGGALEVDGERIVPGGRTVLIRRGSVIRVGKKRFWRVR
ncbi:MAG: tyrosine--tRNA ligase [Candidatus Sungbacteria bacterium RIFCSPLOWO2_01_FULL_59_16]|uniref:Tyrosine--tRNA ligase n=1 Tax=Candidatus Sungbacteria bacterium RIFCSPLOWO2_01_FULL_59_16 TaxID=1802280 RepID=A0A1G2LE97_9BACT|nr:MAG: tyrosine--tRNA ligase [Candidatus Sungbacteria bacterium RIFCSPLOWO2_01_FULL_59_16]